MAYIIERSADDLSLPHEGDHRPRKVRIKVSTDSTSSWAEVICECGIGVRHRWEEETRTYLSILRLSWLDGCGREAYLTPAFASSSRLLWPGGPEPQS